MYYLSSEFLSYNTTCSMCRCHLAFITSLRGSVVWSLGTKYAYTCAACSTRRTEFLLASDPGFLWLLPTSMNPWKATFQLAGRANLRLFTVLDRFLVILKFGQNIGLVFILYLYESYVSILWIWHFNTLMGQLLRYLSELTCWIQLTVIVQEVNLMGC